MTPAVDRPLRRVRFGEFTVDLETGEISNANRKAILQDKPLHVLAALLERPGELITREELKNRLWKADTFVDFDHSLNKAVNRLRSYLGDEAARPQYIETIPRRGYRFIGTLGDMPRNGHKTETPRPLQWRMPGLLLSCVALLIAAAWLWHSSQRRISVVTFTSYPGEESYPSFSPDGESLVFRWDGGKAASPDRWDLYVRRLDGPQTTRRLTWHPAASLAPAWSPNGKYIAFTRSDQEDSGVYLIPAQGGRERRLIARARLAWTYGMLAWTADSKWLAYADVEEPAKEPIRTHIHFLNVATLEERVLPQPVSGCTTSWVPAFSPDGKKLAFACQMSVGVNRLFVEPALGGTAHEATELKGDFHGLAWTADSEVLIYSLDRSLWRVGAAAAGTPQQLPFAHDALQPAVARTGRRLAYSRQVLSSGHTELEQTSGDIVLVEGFR